MTPPATRRLVICTVLTREQDRPDIARRRAQWRRYRIPGRRYF
jgi:hypothetical protein